ncbi:hypothetical protein AADZ86_02900 [Colwelliaceae bacterium BS250]
MTNKSNIDSPNEELLAENTRREFIKKFGKLAIVTPVAVTSLMSPAMSAPMKSGEHPSCKDKPNGNKHCPTTGGF